jgi:hypothetical protein
MAGDIKELAAMVAEMEAALAGINKLNTAVLDFVDANYPAILSDQKVVLVFKNVSDAEDELQRQIKFLRTRLTAVIPGFSELEVVAV